MTEEPWLDDLRAASHVGCRVLEAQILAMGHRLEGPLKPAERRMLCAVCDSIARRVAVWRELVGDEPEMLADLEMLAQRLQELQSWRRPGDPA